MQQSIGENIKILRLGRKMTLKDLSEETGLSIGFLSQVERGLTALAITSLEKIAQALDVDLSYFFPVKNSKEQTIMKSYERSVNQVENDQFIHYQLSNKLDDKEMLPKIIELLPSMENHEIPMDQYGGEVFIYVLEGIFTLIVNKEHNAMYPGDSAHISSNELYSWGNFTNKMVKVIVVHTPNGFKETK